MTERGQNKYFHKHTHVSAAVSGSAYLHGEDHAAARLCLASGHGLHITSFTFSCEPRQHYHSRASDLGGHTTNRNDRAQVALTLAPTSTMLGLPCASMCVSEATVRPSNRGAALDLHSLRVTREQ
jgi:hypothetical protein